MSTRFVHAFPRISRCKEVSKETRDRIGLNILRFILSDGLLLTPEDFCFPIDNESTAYGNPVESVVLQRRASFAFVPVREMMCDPTHQAVFGQFAIGIDTAEARKLGILPTIYYYDQANDKNHSDLSQSEGVSRELLFRLDEIRRILVAVAWMEASAFPGSEDYFSKGKLEFHNYTLVDEPEVWSALRQLTKKNAHDAHKLVDTYRVPATALIGCFDLFLSLFQTADSSYERRHLDYYSQREWRIVAAKTPGIEIADFSEASAENDAFVEAARRNLLDAGFDINIEDCFLLRGASGRDFQEYISDIVIPATALPEIESTLREYSFSPTNSQNEELLHFVRA